MSERPSGAQPSMLDQLAGQGAIVMAVYCPDEELLARQINSVRAQTVTRWTCFVGIDGEDARTVDLLAQLTAGDSRFVVEEFQENAGVYRHFERLLRRVPEGLDWVALADQDDYWYSDKLERLLPKLSIPGVTAVTAQARLVDRHGRSRGCTSRRVVSALELFLHNQVSGALSIFRAELLSMALPFPWPTEIAIHDHWLGLVASSHGRIAVVDELVQDYVQHAGNVLGEAADGGWLRGLHNNQRLRMGPRSRVLYAVQQQWGWRVAMAERLHAVLPANRDRSMWLALSRGRLTGESFVALTRLVRLGRLAPQEMIGLILVAALWQVIGLPTRVDRGTTTTDRLPAVRPGIVVPLFEPSPTVLATIGGLRQQAPVVCVDDGSEETAAPVLNAIERLGNVVLLRCADNGGIARALNLGARHLAGRGVNVIVTFDQDSRPESDHVRRLTAILDRPDISDVGALGPGFVDGVPMFKVGAHHSTIVDVSVLIQSGMAIRSSAFEAIGGFDEAMFIDNVDSDFCLRLRRSGMRVAAFTELDMPHGLGGQTGTPRRYRIGPFRPVATHHSARRRYYMNRNTVLLAVRHALDDPGWMMIHLRRMMASNLLSCTVEPHRWKNLCAITRGIRDGLVMAAR